jgi:uncharacterized membrane protein
MIKLIGLLIIAGGFALRFNPLVVVVAAGFGTGLAAGMSPLEIVELFGKTFTDTRYMTMSVVLMVPVLALLERHGLQERAEQLIGRLKAATPGRVLLLYATLRQISISLGVNIGGHAQMVRPLVAPMAEGAARARHGAIPPATSETIRAHAAAAENVGNFFGEDIFVAVGAVLLMRGFFETQKMEVSVWAMALWGIPTAVAAWIVFAWRARRLDRRVAREVKAKDGAP